MNTLEHASSSRIMAEAEAPEVEETEGEPVAEEKTGFGFQLSESIVHAIDRQIVSSGLRLIMFLPAFAALTFFISWAFAQTSPMFWKDNIEPNLGLGFSTFMVSLGFVVVLGYILAVGFHRYRVSISLATFLSLIHI